jgi:hypothetical protein
VIAIQWIAVDAIKPNPRNARTHSKKQIRQIADSITAFGFVVPIVVDEDGNVIAGGGRYAASILLGLREVPVIRVTPNMMRRRPISAVRPMPVGHWFVRDMTMAASRADPPTGLPCSSSSMTFASIASMSSSSTRSTA